VNNQVKPFQSMMHESRSVHTVTMRNSYSKYLKIMSWILWAW